MWKVLSSVENLLEKHDKWLSPPLTPSLFEYNYKAIKVKTGVKEFKSYNLVMAYKIIQLYKDYHPTTDSYMLHFFFKVQRLQEGTKGEGGRFIIFTEQTWSLLANEPTHFWWRWWLLTFKLQLFKRAAKPNIINICRENEASAPQYSDPETTHRRH